METLDDRSSELVYRYDGNAYPVTWSPDGSKILFEVTHTPFDHDLFLLHLDAKSADLLTPHDGEAAFYSPTFDEAGRFVYCVTDKGREFAALARIDTSSHELEYLYAEDWDVEGLAATEDKRTLAFTVNEGGASRLMVNSNSRPSARSTVINDCPWEQFSYRHRMRRQVLAGDYEGRTGASRELFEEAKRVFAGGVGASSRAGEQKPRRHNNARRELAHLTCLRW